jgi:pescadillo protein
MEKNLTPKMTLDHIIKERYPTFVDALRDLDDCLSMLFLFANLPSTETVPPKTIQLCQRLTHEFEHYLIRSNSLRKSFLSIKGIYYQATIQGQDILWLVPYKFVQRVTGDVDFRIMGTFVQFYTTLLGFVNYRLYTSLGLIYPPKFDAKADEHGAELSAFAIEGRNVAAALDDKVEQPAAAPKQVSATAQAEADKLLEMPSGEEPTSSYVTAQEAPSSNPQDQEEEDRQDGELDAFPAPIDPESDVLHQPTVSASTAANLFEPFTIYLSRETPRHPLEFILRAFGCKRVAWDTVLGEGAYTSDEADRRITHQIVDRPNLPLPAMPVEDEETAAANASKRLRPGERVPGRVYIQPQWVWDCINAGKLLRADLYAPGATLPPHLSPWVKAKQGEYDPTKSLAEQENDGEALAAEAESDEEMADEDAGSDGEEVDGVRGDGEARNLESKLLQQGGKEVVSGEGMDVELAESDDDEDDEEVAAKDEEFGGFTEDEEEDESEDEAARHQRELAAEAEGRSVNADADATPKTLRKKEAEKAQKAISRQRKEAQEETDRQKMMMSRRKRKIFEKMQYSNAKKDAEAEKLRGKRRKIEKGQAQN